MLDQLIADNLRCQAELRTARRVVTAAKDFPHWESESGGIPKEDWDDLNAALAAYEAATK